MKNTTKGLVIAAAAAALLIAGCSSNKNDNGANGTNGAAKTSMHGCNAKNKVSCKT